MTAVRSFESKETEQNKGDWKDSSILSFIDGKHVKTKIFA